MSISSNVAELAKNYSSAELVAALVLKLQPNQDPRRITIETLNLTAGTYNTLSRCGITTLGQLMECTAEELAAVRGFGQKSLDEVAKTVAFYGYKMAGVDRFTEARH